MKTCIAIVIFLVIASITGCGNSVEVQTKYNITIDVINTDGTTSRVTTIHDVRLYNNASFMGSVNTVDWEFNGSANMLNSRSQVIEK